jgi:hypothetical protein
MKIMLNAHIHSVIDYEYWLDIWAVQPEAELQQIQRRIDRFLLEFNCPSQYKKRKKNYCNSSGFNLHPFGQMQFLDSYRKKELHIS